VELAAVELELDVEALLDAHLHLDGPVVVGLSPAVRHYELLLLRYAVVVPVDHHVNVVPQPDDDSVVALKLFFDPIELEVILDIVRQSSGWLQVTDDLEERGVLVLVIEVLDDADELDADAQVVDALVLVQSYGYLALDVFAILHSSITSLALERVTYHEDRRFELVALLVLDGAVLAVVDLVYFDVDFTRSGEAKQIALQTKA